MNPSTEGKAEFLAQLAAAIDPKLAVAEPRKAISHAAALFESAQQSLVADELLLSEEGSRLRQAAAQSDRWFSSAKLLTVEEAFETHRGHFKTLNGFREALRKYPELVLHEQKISNLKEVIESHDVAARNRASMTAKGHIQSEELEAAEHVEPQFEYIERTSLPAVDELFKRIRAAERNADNRRKKRVADAAREARQTKSSEKLTGSGTGKKRKTATKNRKQMRASEKVTGKNRN